MHSLCRDGSGKGNVQIYIILSELCNAALEQYVLFPASYLLNGVHIASSECGECITSASASMSTVCVCRVGLPMEQTFRVGSDEGIPVRIRSMLMS